MSTTVANASGSECSVLFPCFSVANASAYSSFRVLLLLILLSVKFRVNPWQNLLLILVLHSVANAYS